MSETLDFYTNNADDFFNRTAELDLAALYDEFLPFIPKGGSILDAGCGSGRDSQYFLDHGYTIHAIDAVPEMAERASRFIGQTVEVITFESFQSIRLFDGIWACASLLHVPTVELPSSINNLASFLNPGGVFYMSFKYGRGERRRGKRLFSDLDEVGVNNIEQQLSELTLNKAWVSEDRRPERSSDKWMNTVWVR